MSNTAKAPALRIDITENADNTWNAKVFFDNVIAFGESYFLSKKCAEDFVMSELEAYFK